MVSEIIANFRGWITNKGLFGIFHLETDHKYIDINSMLKSLTIPEQKALIQRIQINIKNQKARHEQ